jgi:uncharacterized protein YegJ (DUF2314 family)
VPSHVIVSFIVIALAIVLAWALLRGAVRDAREPKPGGGPPKPGARGGGEAAGGGARPVKERRHPPTSLTVLLREPVALDEETVADAVERAWGVRPSHNEEEAVSFVQNPTAVITSVQVKGNVFAIISMPEPYAHDRDWYVRDETPSELITAWQQHRGWLSVDLVLGAREARSEDVYGYIGKLVAALVDDEGLAVFRPGKRHAIVYDAETRTLLRRTNPLTVVTGGITSLVLLLSAPRQVETAELLSLVRRAWGADVGSDPSLSDFAAAPKPPYGFIQYDGLRLGLITPDGPYVRDLSAATADIADVRVRDALARHKAWLSVDMIEAPVGVARGHVYKLIARLIAELIDGRALLLYAPELQRAVPVTDTLAARLRAEDPLTMLMSPEHPPVVDVTGDDPRMAAAVAEARRRLPEFVGAFAKRRRGATDGGGGATGQRAGREQHFAVKCRFADGAHAEFMWVRVTAVAGPSGGEVFTGVLDNAPFRVRSVKLGDAVTCPAAEVVDWLYTDVGGVRGNFTAAVLAAVRA